MEVASSVEQRGWKGDLEKMLFCSFSKFPSWAFQVLERSSFWAFWCVCEWSFLFGGVASMGCNCINIDITTIIIVFTNASIASVGCSYIRKLSHLPRCNKGPSVANIIWEELDLLSTLHSLAKITINFSRRPLLVLCRAFDLFILNLKKGCFVKSKRKMCQIRLKLSDMND